MAEISTNEVLIIKNRNAKMDDEVDLNIEREFEIDPLEYNIKEENKEQFQSPNLFQLLYHLSSKKNYF